MYVALCSLVFILSIYVCFLVTASLVYFHSYWSARTGILDPNVSVIAPVHDSISVCTCVCVCMCACVHACMCACVHVCVCVFVCLWVGMGMDNWRGGPALCLRVTLVLFTVKCLSSALSFLYIFSFLCPSKAASCSQSHLSILDWCEFRRFGKGCFLVSSASASVTTTMGLRSFTSESAHAR